MEDLDAMKVIKRRAIVEGRMNTRNLAGKKGRGGRGLQGRCVGRRKLIPEVANRSEEGLVEINVDYLFANSRGCGRLPGKAIEQL